MWEVLPVIFHSGKGNDLAERREVLSSCAQPRVGNIPSGCSSAMVLLAVLQWLSSQVWVILFLPCLWKLIFHVTYYVQLLQWWTPRDTGWGKKKKSDYVIAWYSSCCQALYLCPVFAATSGKHCRRSHYAIQSLRICKADAVKPGTNQSINLTLSQIDY